MEVRANVFCSVTKKKTGVNKLQKTSIRLIQTGIPKKGSRRLIRVKSSNSL